MVVIVLAAIVVATLGAIVVVELEYELVVERDELVVVGAILVLELERDELVVVSIPSINPSLFIVSNDSFVVTTFSAICFNVSLVTFTEAVIINFPFVFVALDKCKIYVFRFDELDKGVGVEVFKIEVGVEDNIKLVFGVKVERGI